MIEIIKNLADQLPERLINKRNPLADVDWSVIGVDDGFIVDREYHNLVRQHALREGRRLGRKFITRIYQDRVHVLREA